jgi:hypothetical protein
MPAHRASYEDALHNLIELSDVRVRKFIWVEAEDYARGEAVAIAEEGHSSLVALIASVWRKPGWMVLMDARRLHMKRAA